MSPEVYDALLNQEDTAAAQMIKYGLLKAEERAGYACSNSGSPRRRTG